MLQNKFIFAIILSFSFIQAIFCEDATFCYFTRKNLENCTKIKFDQTNRFLMK